HDRADRREDCARAAEAEAGGRLRLLPAAGLGPLPVRADRRLLLSRAVAAREGRDGEGCDLDAVTQRFFQRSAGHMPGEIGGIEGVAGANRVDYLDLRSGNPDFFAAAPRDRACRPALDQQGRGGWQEAENGVSAAEARNLLLVEQDVVGKP